VARGSSARIRNFLSLVPDTEITLEHAILLLTELVRGEQMELGRCLTCQVLILVDRLSVAAKECAHCAHEARSGLPYPLTLHATQSKPSSTAQESDDPMPECRGGYFERDPKANRPR
jgi:hypothetical protein